MRDMSPEHKDGKRKFWNVVREDPRVSLNVGLSMLLRRKRNLLKDSEHLSRHLELTNIFGTENIPIGHSSIIIAVNHPGVYELFAGVTKINQAVSSIRKSQGLPGDIHWLVAKNFAVKDPISTKEKMALAFFNLMLKKLHNVYDFVSVPINYDNSRKKQLERARVLFTARKHLHNPSGSKIIGIFPEGNFGNPQKELLPFFEGIGVLGRFAANPTIVILPTGIYRDQKDNLTVELGSPLTIWKEESAQIITQRVRRAIDIVTKKP